MNRVHRFLAVISFAALAISACSPLIANAQKKTLVVYSGRSESLVGPVIEQFEQASGIEVEVRWGNTSELAATLLEEGEKSPADVYFAQDPGGLGAVVDMLAPLPEDTLNQVEARFRDAEGRWVGISGRARVVVYNTDTLTPEALPSDLWGFIDPSWKGRIGFAPTNASFQTMITGMRAVWGEERTREWLAGFRSNDPVAYENNTSIVAAVGAGEVEVGLVNHYYLYRFLTEEGQGFPARNHFFSGGGPESLVMSAGAGVIKTTDQPEEAQRFINFLLSPVAQQYFATQTFEYPLVEGVVTDPGLPPLADLNSADIHVTDLADLQGTVKLLQETGVLP